MRCQKLYWNDQDCFWVYGVKSNSSLIFPFPAGQLAKGKLFTTFNGIKTLNYLFGVSASFLKTCSLTMYLIQACWSTDASKSCRTEALEGWSC